MRSFLEKEYQVFLGCPRNMRILLVTNFVYALALPIIEIFIAAYVMRNSHDVRLVMSYQLSLFTGIPFAFFLNGHLLRLVSARRLYSLGMVLSGVSMTVIISLAKVQAAGVITAGLIMGLSYGLYWANRDYLALTSTNDGNRNYYYGVEIFLATLCGLVVPVSIGWFIASTDTYHWFGGDRNQAYRILTVALFLLAGAASLIVHRGNFKNPPHSPFLFWRFQSVWYWMQSMAILKGLTQGFIATAPAMLVMRYLGEEGTLGILQTAGGILAAATLYAVGRLTRPEHRPAVFLTGLLLFFGGCLWNAVFFGRAGAIVLLACLILAKPLLDAAYFPIQMRVIDYLKERENRDGFSYIFSHEFGLYVGRLSGGLLFIGVATYISETAALRYTFLLIGGLQLLSIFLAKVVLAKCQPPVARDNSLSLPVMEAAGP